MGSCYRRAQPCLITHTPTPQRGQSTSGYRDGPVHSTTGSVNGHPNGVGMVQFLAQPEVIMTMPHLRVGMVQFSVQPEVIMTMPLAQLESYHILILCFPSPGQGKGI